jgi:hypothetical protein
MLDEDGLQRPQSFLCSKVIGKQYTKPSKLKEHLQTVHSQNAKTKSSEHNLQQGSTFSNHGFISQKKPGLEASYHEALWINKGTMPHIIKPW